MEILIADNTENITSFIILQEHAFLRSSMQHESLACIKHIQTLFLVLMPIPDKTTILKPRKFYQMLKTSTETNISIWRIFLEVSSKTNIQTVQRF